MSKKVRIAALGIAFVMLLPLLLLGFTSSAAQEDTPDYTKKVVSVVYDNSYSMCDAATGGEHRSQFAEYALQMLIALLGTNDTLWITPMTEEREPVTDPKQSFQVFLDEKTDRDKEIKRIMDTYKDTKLRPMGDATPQGSIDVALQHLLNEGLKQAGDAESLTSKTEYWLVVLTDGTFNQPNMETQAVLEPYLYDKATESAKYANFQMVYMGLGGTSKDMSNTELKKHSNFTPLKAGSATEFASAIQQLANRLTGRYTLPISAFEQDGNKIKVDFSSCGFPLRSVSFVAQNCGGTLESATYGGKTLTVNRKTTLRPDPILGLSSGCSGVIPADPLFTGGTMELTFSAPVSPEMLSVMIEPALYIQPVFEANVGGNWQEVDMKYVCSEMKVDDAIRIAYKVFREDTGAEVKLSDVFTIDASNPVEERVSAGGKGYDIRQDIPLVEGTNEIILSVNVKSAGYTMYTSANFYIERDATAYRVESQLVENAGSPTKSQSIFTVYSNHQALNKAAMADYKWSVKATSPSGNSVDVTASLNDEGKIVAELDTAGREYGDYTVEATVISPYLVEKSGSTTVTHVPQSLLVTPENGALSMTQHAYKFNTEGFSFLLTGEGKDLSFTSNMVSYTVTFNGIDVTEYAVVDGNRLSYLPSVEHDASLAEGSGEKTADVKVTATVVKKPSVTHTGTATLTITPTKYEIIPITKDEGRVDRFSLTDNEISTYFAITRDGIHLTEEELKTSLERGDITFNAPVTSNFFLPAGEEVSVTTVDGTPVVRYKVTSDQPGIIRWFTSMFLFSGDKDVTASYSSSQGTGKVTVDKASFFSYLWRILLICLIIHILLIIFLIKKSPRHVKGYLVHIPIGIPKNGYPDSVNVKAVNMSLGQKIVPARLFNPMAAQKPYTHFDARVTVGKDGVDYITMDSENCLRFKPNELSRTDRTDAFTRLVDAIRNGSTVTHQRTGANTFDITNSKYKEIFVYKLQNGTGKQAQNLLSSDRPEQLTGSKFYAVYNGNKALTAIYFFIPKM